MSTSNEPVKARIRHVSSDNTKECIVKYSELRPLTDPRPVHMYSGAATAVNIADVREGNFVFFYVKGRGWEADFEAGPAGELNFEKNQLFDLRVDLVHSLGRPVDSRAQNWNLRTFENEVFTNWMLKFKCGDVNFEKRGGQIFLRH